MYKFFKKLKVFSCDSFTAEHSSNNIPTSIDLNPNLDSKIRIDKPFIDFKSFSLKHMQRRSYSSEVTIPVKINNIQLHALLDSGSESSIISLDILNKYFKNWECSLSDGFSKPDFGIGVDGSTFKILAVKIFEVQVGKNNIYAQISVPERGSDLIFGLDLLKLFQIKLIFATKILIYSFNEFISASDIQHSKTEILFNNCKILLNPNQTKTLSIPCPALSENNSYLVYAHKDSPSIIIPCIANVNNKEINVSINNDSKKKLWIKKNFLKICVETLLNGEEKQKDITSLCFLNLPKEKKQIHSDISLEELSSLPGFSLPKIHFPIKPIIQLITDDLSNNYSKTQKLFLEKAFEKYSGLVAQFTYDVGKMRDHKGNPILMNIPLKSKLPTMTKSYKLSPDERSALNDILDYLIYFGLAIPADVNNQTGSPAFLVSRPDENRAHRLITDTREVNTYISSPVSTYSDNVNQPLKDIIKKYDYVSLIDLSNAYYGIRLDQETLDTNISQIYTENRCVRFLSPLTGLANIPLYWSQIVGREMSLSDAGLFDPLTTNRTMLKFWIDDFLIGSVGNEEEHAVLLDKFLYRLNRLGLKINIRKSSFFVKIKTDTFKLLGFQVKKGKIVPDTNKISIIKDFKKPSCKTELQRFLGYLTFIRDLLPHKLIDLMTVLSPLSSNTTKFVWEEKHTIAFNLIKELLDENFSYNEAMSDPYIKRIYTDASLSLMGGILFNYNIDHFSHPPPPSPYAR